ncbi:DedA family protein [Curtobacterium sp. MCBD17_013]|uniref:DedA family protein n=1 Tax=Curtobacterium sp. MCBD17_013 TaxID=2175668 RepID=UPI000DA940DB|nr:DedA family protein [Curtobacterium sp. MCBD17_013]PZF63682.1 DedA family protein [Curtobacterium sp. MCBD17_013]
MTMTATARTDGPSGVGGLTGFVLEVVDRLGEWGVGLLLFAETVFPPIPSEVILPLAGFLAGAGAMDLALVLVAATIGSWLGALALYALGARVGLERSIGWAARLPLVDEDDLRRAAHWFDRHGAAAVFLGRLVPGVRSLVSLPAGAGRMHLVTFSVYTVLGSVVWNTALVLAGAALGSRWELLEGWSAWIDRGVYAALVAVVAVFVVRRVRRRGRERRQRG